MFELFLYQRVLPKHVESHREKSQSRVYNNYLQGGAMNRGLLFVGLPLPPWDGCERKD
jgi:hypothetical protein